MDLATTTACGAITGGGLALLTLTALGTDGHSGCGSTATNTSTPARRSTAPRAAARSAAPSTLLRRAVLATGVGIALAAVTSWPVLELIGTAGAWFLPRLLRSDGGAGARLEKVDAVAAFTESLRDTLTAAAGLGQAIAAAAACAPDAIAFEARELAALIQDRTLPMDKALRAFGDKLADPTGDLVVITLMYAARNPARDLAPLLSDLAAAAREEAAMRVRIGIAHARTRTTVRVITAVTLGLGAVLYLADGPFLAPYGTPLGQLALLAISTLFATAFAWLAHLTRPAPQPRLLHSQPDVADTNPYAPAIVSGQVPAPRRAPARRAGY